MSTDSSEQQFLNVVQLLAVFGSIVCFCVVGTIEIDRCVTNRTRGHRALEGLCRCIEGMRRVTARADKDAIRQADNDAFEDRHRLLAKRHSYLHQSSSFKVKSEEEKAATKIQAVHRGRSQRMEMARQNSAATMLQKMQRGKVARLEVNKLRNQRQGMTSQVYSVELDLRHLLAAHLHADRLSNFRMEPNTLIHFGLSGQHFPPVTFDELYRRRCSDPPELPEGVVVWFDEMPEWVLLDGVLHLFYESMQRQTSLPDSVAPAAPPSSPQPALHPDWSAVESPGQPTYYSHSQTGATQWAPVFADMPQAPPGPI